MSHLLYAKICMILTVGIAGLNLHQFFSSYSYVKENHDWDVLTDKLLEQFQVIIKTHS